MSNEIYLTGDVGGEISIDRIIKFVNDSDKNEDLHFHIYTEGGDAYQGIHIYKYLKQVNQTIHTYSLGLVASAGTPIFLSAKKENRNGIGYDKILIHNPWTMAMGESSDFAKVKSELEDIENEILNIYVEETDLTREEAKSYMDGNEFLPMDVVNSKGFISTSDKVEAVAKINNTNLINKMDKIDITKEEKTVFDKVLAKLGIGLGEKAEKPKNIIVKTASQDELNFFELEDGAEPKVGDKATLNGETADGEVVINESITYVFVAGVLEEIKEADTEETGGEDLEAKLKALEEENERLKASVSNSVDKEVFNKKVSELESLEKEKKEVETKYNTLMNKLTDFKPTETVDTTVKNKNEKEPVKESLSDRLNRLSNKNKNKK